MRLILASARRRKKPRPSGRGQRATNTKGFSPGQRSAFASGHNFTRAWVKAEQTGAYRTGIVTPPRMKFGDPDRRRIDASHPRVSEETEKAPAFRPGTTSNEHEGL